MLSAGDCPRRTPVSPTAITSNLARSGLTQVVPELSTRQLKSSAPLCHSKDHPTLTSWYNSCGTIGSGIWVKYRLKIVATSCVVYVVFFQSRFFPYYRDVPDGSAPLLRMDMMDRLTLGGLSNTAWSSFIRLADPETLNVPGTSVAVSLRYRPHLATTTGTYLSPHGQTTTAHQLSCPHRFGFRYTRDQDSPPDIQPAIHLGRRDLHARIPQTLHKRLGKHVPLLRSVLRGIPFPHAPLPHPGRIRSRSSCHPSPRSTSTHTSTSTGRRSPRRMIGGRTS